MNVLFALLIMLVGAAALFAGYRLFRQLLPLFGFVVGFFAGAGFIAAWLGEGFLQGVLGAVLGLALGLVLAFIAYTWWWLGVIIAIGGFGFALGYGILPAIGIDVGVVNFLIALVVGTVLAAAAMVLRLPRTIVIVETALWGAAAVIGGLLVLTGQLDVEGLGSGAVEGALSISGLWTVVWLVLAGIGIAAQLASARDMDVALYEALSAESNVRTP